MRSVCYRKDRQCASLTTWSGRPFWSRYLTAFSILRPYDDCIHSSDAYAPITRNAVFIVSDAAIPPRCSTAFSQSLREPNTKIPVNANLKPSKRTFGAGSQSGSVVDFRGSPISKSSEPVILERMECRSARSSSSMTPSLRTSAIRRTRSATIGLLVISSEAASHFSRYSISRSFSCSSAINPRANPISSVICRSSKRARLYRVYCIFNRSLAACFSQGASVGGNFGSRCPAIALYPNRPVQPSAIAQTGAAE